MSHRRFHHPEDHKPFAFTKESDDLIAWWERKYPAERKAFGIAGLSVVTLIFDEGSDLLRHRQGVVERLAQLGNQLPPGVQAGLTPLTSSASTVLGLGLTSTTLDALALRSLVDTAVRPHLLAVPGVADVIIIDGPVAFADGESGEFAEVAQFFVAEVAIAFVVALAVAATMLPMSLHGFVIVRGVGGEGAVRVVFAELHMAVTVVLPVADFESRDI